MTYTILARCPQSGQLGVGIATYSLGVGGYCPFFSRARGLLSTQAFANPALGPLAIASLNEGRTPERTLGDLAAADPGFDFRQIGILAFDGSIGMHTGSRCRAWAGHVVGTGFAAFGNVLAGESTVQAMAESYRVNHALALDARLLLALDAGRAAGGQAAADGTHLPERSAALMVRNDDIVMDIDLRVDLNDDAVTELRRVHHRYAPFREYYALRARDPANTPPQDVWARENAIDGND